MECEQPDKKGTGRSLVRYFTSNNHKYQLSQ